MSRNKIIIITLLILCGATLFFAVRPWTGKNAGEQFPPGNVPGQQGVAPVEGQGGGESQSAMQAASADEWGDDIPSVEIPLEKQQLIGVKTAVVGNIRLTKIIRTVGIVEYDETRITTVNTKYEGWIEKLYADYSGRYVRKGEPLAEIYSPELFATQQEFINLKKWSSRQKTEPGEPFNAMIARDAESIIEAARQRLKLWDLTDEQIAMIEKNRTPFKTMKIYSPLSGYIIQKTALLGMRVMPGEKLFDIADLSIVWILSDIYEYELPFVRVGQKARITLSSFPGREFTSRINFIYPAISGATRSAKVRFSIPNPGGQLKPQMYSNVEVKIPLGSRLAVPEDAIIDTGTKQVVYVVKGDGYFEPREILTGLKSDNMVEVIRGLTSGEKIATSATFLIDSEAKLKGIMPQ